MLVVLVKFTAILILSLIITGVIIMPVVPVIPFGLMKLVYIPLLV
jgi:hypothetical protein